MLAIMTYELALYDKRGNTVWRTIHDWNMWRSICFIRIIVFEEEANARTVGEGLFTLRRHTTLADTQFIN